MSENFSNIGITLPEDEKFSSGIGYIALPSDIERQKYILNCYQNMWVSIHTAHDGFMNRVMISEEDMNWIEFPTDYKQLGTPIYYIVDPTNNQPYIIKRFGKSNKLGTGVENQFKFGRIFNDSLVEISGNPNEGYLNLVVSNNKKAKININVINEDDKGELNLNLRGSVNINASKDVSISVNGKIYEKVFDALNDKVFTEFIQEKGAISANTPSLKINDGNENFVLGQKLKTFLTQLITTISQATVVTPDGTFPLINSTAIANFNSQIDSFLSSVGFIDK